jgi:hypothetical protein
LDERVLWKRCISPFYICTIQLWTLLELFLTVIF